jgi:thioredoxin 1
METQETTEQILEDVKTGKHILKMWAPWCGPCKAYAPTFDEATAEVKDGGVVKVRSINVDDHPGVAQKFGIRGIPATVFVNGDKVNQIAGAKSVAELKTAIAMYL